MHMKAITLRNVPPDVARRIEKLARAEGVSFNKATIRLLRQAVAQEGRGKRARPSDDELSALAGTWSKKEADAFDEGLCAERKIDPEMWK